MAAQSFGCSHCYCRSYSKFDRGFTHSMAPTGSRSEKKGKVSAKSTMTNTASPSADIVKITYDQASPDSSFSDSMAADIAQIFNLLQKMSDEHNN